MSRSAVSVALLALLGLLSSASAFRSPRDFLDLPGDLSTSFIQDFFTGGENKKDRREGPVYFSIKFTVAPHEYDNFAKEWQHLEKKTRKEDKGSIIYDLKKTVTDDVFFLHYAEWETGRDLFKHLFSRHFKDFVEYTTKNNVKWELDLLRNPDDEEEKRESLRTVSKKGDDTTTQAHVIVKVLVKPDDAEDFIDAWQKAADHTVKEKGNNIYSLRKVARDNVQFWIYGTWESYKDYEHHAESDHVRDLLDFYKDRDIVFFRSPLLKYGRDDEGGQ